MAKKILIMAAGTGGHIIPALAVAKKVMQQGIEVLWLGTETGLEQQLVPPIPLATISMHGIRKKGFINRLSAPFTLLRSIWQSSKLIKKFQPDIVIGFGGYVTAPGGIAAWLLRKPLVIHEQNAIAGLSNRCLAIFAKQIFQAFPETFSQRYQAITTGNPVREEIIALPVPTLRPTHNGPLRLLIIGGSQGATIFNETLPDAIHQLEQPVEILHSAGKRFTMTTKNNYQQRQINAQVVAFIDNMADAYSWADLVICRSGALTVAELAAAGVASLLIPYPFAVDDHQTKNGQWLVKVGGAILIPQANFNAKQLAGLLNELNCNRQRLKDMAIAARSAAIIDATNKIAEFIGNSAEPGPKLTTPSAGKD